VLTDEGVSVAHEAKRSPAKRESTRSEAESREAGGLRARMTEKINLVFMIIIFYRLDDRKIQKDVNQGQEACGFTISCNFNEYVIYEI